MRLVLIEWVDSASGGGWSSLEHAVRESDAPLCKSVGWLIAESKISKTVAPNILERERNSQVCEPMTIPAVAIRRMVDIGETRKRKRRRVK